MPPAENQRVFVEYSRSMGNGPFAECKVAIAIRFRSASIQRQGREVYRLEEMREKRRIYGLSRDIKPVVIRNSFTRIDQLIVSAKQIVLPVCDGRNCSPLAANHGSAFRLDLLFKRKHDRFAASCQ